MKTEEHLALSEGAVNAFPTFGSKTRDRRILARGILKCFSQENMGQNIVRSGIHDIASTGNIATEDIYSSELEPARIRPVVYLVVCFSCLRTYQAENSKANQRSFNSKIINVKCRKFFHT